MQTDRQADRQQADEEWRDRQAAIQTARQRGRQTA